MQVGALGTVLGRVLCFYFLVGFCWTTFFPNEAMSEEGFSSGSPNLPQPLISAWRSVAQIRRVSSGKGGAQSWTENGSGVVISQLSPTRVLVVTNAHVGGCPKKLNCRYRIQIQDTFATSLSGASVRLLKDFPTVDLAFLEVTVPNGKYAVASLAPTGSPAESSEVWSIGFPTLEERPSKSWTVPRPSDHKFFVRRVSYGRVLELRGPVVFSPYPYHPLTMVTLNVSQLILHSADTISGNSGGALVNSKGELVGIPTGIFNGNSEQKYCPEALDPEERCFYYAIPASLVLEKLAGTMKLSTFTKPSLL